MLCGPKRLDEFTAATIERLTKSYIPRMFMVAPQIPKPHRALLSQITLSWNIPIDPRLLNTAFTPRRVNRYNFNEELAFLGSFIFALYCHEHVSSAYDLTEAQAYDCLDEGINLTKYLALLYPQLEEMSSRQQRVDVLQAVVAAAVFSCGFDDTMTWLDSLVVPRLATLPQVSIKTFGKSCRHHSEGYSQFIFRLNYTLTLLLQHYTQALLPQGRPSYRYSAVGPAHKAIQQCWATFQGVEGYGEGQKRKNAANRAAYELLSALRRGR